MVNLWCFFVLFKELCKKKMNILKDFLDVNG